MQASVSARRLGLALSVLRVRAASSSTAANGAAAAAASGTVTVAELEAERQLHAEARITRRDFRIAFEKSRYAQLANQINGLKLRGVIVANHENTFEVDFGLKFNAFLLRTLESSGHTSTRGPPAPAVLTSEITRVGRAVHAVLNDAELSTHVLGNPVDISGLRATATFVGFEASPADAQQTLARAAPAPTATTTATAPTETAAAESQSPPADAEQSSAVAARVAAAMQEVDDRDRLRQTLQDKADASEAQVNAVLAAFKQLQASHPGAPLYDFLSTVVQMQQREEPETSSVDDLASTTVADWQRGLQWMQAYDEEIAKLTQSPSSSSSSDSSAEVNSAASKTAEDSPASAQRKTPRRPKNSRATDPAEPDARR